MTAREGGAAFAELQVQHQTILKYNDDSHAHDHYDFFRVQLAASYGPTLDAMLRRTIDFMEEVAGLPVLLSLLVLIFKQRRESDPSPLPTDLFELYRVAVQLSVGDDGAEAVLRTLACANQLARRREFTSEDVGAALSAEQLERWKGLLQGVTKHGSRPTAADFHAWPPNLT